MFALCRSLWPPFMIVICVEWSEIAVTFLLLWVVVTSEY